MRGSKKQWGQRDEGLGRGWLWISSDLDPAVKRTRIVFCWVGSHFDKSWAA